MRKHPYPPRGSSTLEILIALFVLSLTLCAVILVIFGNQSLAIDAHNYQEALGLSKAQLEWAHALAEYDFNLLNSTSSTKTIDSITYTESLTVTQADLFTKKIDSAVLWQQGGRTVQVNLSTLLTNPTGLVSGNSCSSVLTSGWATPQLTGPIAIGSNTGGNPVTSMHAFNKKLYVTTSNTSGHNNDFYIFSLLMPQAPTLLSELDTNTTTAGLNDVAIASTTTNVFGFVANGVSPNFTTCSESATCSQLQILDMTNVAHPSVVRNYKLNSTLAPFVKGSGGQANANTVVYSNGYVYLGLTKTALGPEFNILDVGAKVGTPTNPVYLGGFSVGRGVSSITVSHGYAYLTTSDTTRELIVLDIHNPANPTQVTLFDAPGSSGFGLGNTSTVLGSTVFLGRNYVSNAPEFYALAASNPLGSLPVISSLDIGTNAHTEGISSLIVRGTIVFMTTTRTVQLWDITSITTPTLITSLDLSASGSVGITSTCEGNTVYIGGYKTATYKGAMYILSAT